MLCQDKNLMSVEVLYEKMRCYKMKVSANMEVVNMRPRSSIISPNRGNYSNMEIYLSIGNQQSLLNATAVSLYERFNQPGNFVKRWLLVQMEQYLPPGRVRYRPFVVNTRTRNYIYNRSLLIHLIYINTYDTKVGRTRLEKLYIQR